MSGLQQLFIGAPYVGPPPPDVEYLVVAGGGGGGSGFLGDYWVDYPGGTLQFTYGQGGGGGGMKTATGFSVTAGTSIPSRSALAVLHQLVTEIPATVQPFLRLA